MENPNTLRGTLNGAGLRWTSQRRAVAEVLWGNRKHPSADEIYAAARKRYPGMSRATVYNTLDALAGIGQIRTVPDVDGRRRYDPNVEPHHHLQCVGCGRIVDIPCHGVSMTLKLGDALGRGFRVFSHRVDFMGLCPRCAGKPARDRCRWM